MLTMDNFRKQHIIMVDWCCIYRKSGVTTDNLLLHFEVAKEICDLILCLFQVQWVKTGWVVDLLTCKIG